MKTKTTRNPQHTLFFYRVAMLLTLTLLVAAGGGLSLLWLRNESSAAASRIRATETRLSETKRRLQFVNVKIAEATTPDALRRRSAQMGLALVAPRQEQVVRMMPVRSSRTDEPATALADAGTPEPILVSFELALIKSGAVTN